MFNNGLTPLEPNLTINLETQSVHYIQVSGYSTDPLVNYYYGKFRVITKRTPNAPADALACFRTFINNPAADQQFYTVYDRYNRLISEIVPDNSPTLPENSITRIEFHSPIPLTAATVTK